MSVGVGMHLGSIEITGLLGPAVWVRSIAHAMWSCSVMSHSACYRLVKEPRNRVRDIGDAR